MARRRRGKLSQEVSRMRIEARPIEVIETTVLCTPEECPIWELAAFLIWVTVKTISD